MRVDMDKRISHRCPFCSSDNIHVANRDDLFITEADVMYGFDILVECFECKRAYYFRFDNPKVIWMEE